MGAGVVTTHIVKLLFVVLSTGEIGGEFFSDDRTGSAPTHTPIHTFTFFALILNISQCVRQKSPSLDKFSFE